MLARDSDEVLSFGTFPSADGPFEPHASLSAQANGTLAVKAAGLDLLPGGGNAFVGSGMLCLPDSIPNMWSLSADWVPRQDHESMFLRMLMCQ